MAQTVLRCPAAMPADLLAAWHDHTLNADQTVHVRAHVAGCPACQAYLADYTQDDLALRRADTPALQERIWRGVRADITQSPQRRAGLPRNAILGSLGAVLAVTILFAAVFIFVLDNKGSTRSISVAPTASATATNTVMPTPTVTPLHVTPSQGWVQDASLNFGKSVAFAPSAPYTGYVCGNTTTVIGLTQSLLLSVTHDGGRTWSSPVTTPVKGANCYIFINPHDPQDLILEGNALWGPGDGSEAQSGFHYRSRDGGQTWIKLVFPESGEYIWLESPTWIGTTLFAITINSSQSSTGPLVHQLAMSINGGPLEWIDPSNSFRSDNEGIISIFAIDSTLYVASPGNCRPYGVCQIAKTGDNGTSWSNYTVNNPAIRSIILSVDGRTLFGSDIQHTFYTSSNNGQTWTVQPTIPGGNDTYILYQDLPIPNIFSMPDGSVYVLLQSTSNIGNTFGGIYKLEPQATGWTKINTNLFLRTVSWDMNGHAVALWSTSSYNGGQFSPGIAYHSA